MDVNIRRMIDEINGLKTFIKISRSEAVEAICQQYNIPKEEYYKKYFQELNNQLERDLTDPYIRHHLMDLHHVNILSKLMMDIGYDRLYNRPLKKYEKHQSIEESIEIVKKFLGQLHPEYLKRFEYYLKNDYPSRFKLIDKNVEGKSKVKNGQTYIEYNETIKDVFTIVHEYFHKFSCYDEIDHNSFIKDVFGETTAIAAEFLLEDFLVENKIVDNDELYYHKLNRMLISYEDAFATLFQEHLIALYENSQNVNMDILLDCLNSIKNYPVEYNIFSQKGNLLLDDIVKDGLSFHKRQRYVIATMLASTLHAQIKSDGNEINNLLDLVAIFRENNKHHDSNLLKVAEKLRLPFINNGKVDINKEIVDKLSTDYENELSSISFKNNMDNQK
jgi:hypothetical protein